jgi:prepilin-type N-terminal cleavage/methylation domain-containing protein
MITPVKLIRKIRNREGFTLVEVIIAASIFTVVSVLAVVVFVNVMRIQRRIMLENAIYEDARFLMERIAREIRQNTIDYEEYYRFSGSEAGADYGTYGQYFGCYASRFYDPGSDGKFGYECSLGTVPDCTVVNKNTLDINTGENPYSGPTHVSTNANAVCDVDNFGNTTCVPLEENSGSSYLQEQLFLINPKGTQKTFIARKAINDEYEHGAAIVRLYGVDADTDGIAESWTGDSGYNCMEGFDCEGLDVENRELENTLIDANKLYKGFVPFTPLRTNVKALHFYISPLEDPRKAFAETDPDEGIQQQPHVTVVLTMQPAVSELLNYAGETPTVTLQTTVSSRVYNEVRSFLGEATDCPANTP